MKLVLSRSSFSKSKGKDLVLLGDYCLPPSEELTGYRIVEHPWSDACVFDRDYETVRERYRICLQQIAHTLNKFHDSQASVRQWEIMIGPWLRIFLVALQERLQLLNASITSHSITDVLVHDTSGISKAAFNTSDFLSKIEGWCEEELDLWSEMLTLDIFEKSGMSSDIDVTNISQFSIEEKKCGRKRQSLKKRAVSALDALLHRRSKVLIHRFGRPLKTELAMFLSARMLPHFSFPEYELGREESQDGSAFRFGRLNISGTGVDDILNALIPLYLPQSFVENHNSIRNYVHRTYPKSPSVIATSVSYYRDDTL